MALVNLDTTLPSGISGSSLVAQYVFDGTVDSLTDRSGNGHGLTAANAPVYGLADPNIPGIILSEESQHWVYTDAKAGVFNTTGALTVEWIAKNERYDASFNGYLFCVGDPHSATQSLNVTVAVYIRDSDAGPSSINSFHEYGSGLDQIQDHDWSIPFVRPSYGALTRASDGKTYRLYGDGELLSTKAATNAPDGGTSASVRLLIGNSHWFQYSRRYVGWVGSIRYCHAEFSADQVAEAYDLVSF